MDNRENSLTKEQYIERIGYFCLFDDTLMSKCFEDNRECVERVKYFKENEKGVTEMCEIMEELYNEGVETGRQEGIEAGMQRGIEAGRQEGIETGRREGMEQGRNKMICCFLMNGGTEEAAMKMLNVTKEDIEAAKEMAGC